MLFLNRKGLVVGLVMLFYLSSLVCATSTTFNSAATFDTGSYFNLGYNTGDFLNLTRNNESGVYQSAVTDTGRTAIFSTYTWKFERCYACELPINQAVETSYATNVNMTGNVVYFKFNETSLDSLPDGNDTLDSSGNGWNGYVNGSTTDYGKTGLFSKAINFTANSNKVVVPNFPYIANFTVSAWIKLNATTTTDRYMFVISRGTYAATNLNYGLGIRRRNIGSSDGWWAFIFARNGASLIGGSSETEVYIEGNDNGMYDWHHLAATYTTGTKNLTLYFDGVAIDSSIQTVNPSSASNLNLSIGGEYTTGSFSFFSGLVDEVAIWNRTLSASEMKSLYYRGAYNVSMQIRSCSTSNCADTPSFSQTLYSSSGQSGSLSLSNNRYLQFNTTLSRIPHYNIISSVNSSPVWYNFSLDYNLANSFYNVPSGWSVADNDTDAALTSGSDVFATVKQVSLKNAGTKVADVWLDLAEGDADLSNLAISSSNTDSEKKAVIDWRDVIPGDNLQQEDHALYVDATWSNGAYVCPNAYTTGDVSSSCSGKVSFTHAQCVAGATQSGITCTITNSQYKLSGLSGTGIAANGNAQLTINDSAEGSTISTNTAINFYAYYHNATSDAHIASATCQVLFDDAAGVWVNMTADTSNGRYNYTKSSGFASGVVHTWEVNCSKSGYTTLDTTDTVSVTAVASVPEFNDYALMLALLLAALGGIGVANKIEE